MNSFTPLHPIGEGLFQATRLTDQMLPLNANVPLAEGGNVKIAIFGYQTDLITTQGLYLNLHLAFKDQSIGAVMSVASSDFLKSGLFGKAKYAKLIEELHRLNYFSQHLRIENEDLYGGSLNFAASIINIPFKRTSMFGLNKGQLDANVKLYSHSNTIFREESGYHSGGIEGLRTHTCTASGHVSLIPQFVFFKTRRQFFYR